MMVVIAVAATVLAAPNQANDLKLGTLVGKVVVTTEKRDQDTVVYLKEVKGNYPAPQKPAVLLQKGKEFLPHLLPVQRGQTVRFKNGDPFVHNVHVYWERRSMFNQSEAANSEMTWAPPRVGEYLVLCNIHPEMMAGILVFDNPFFAAVPSSDFKIENVPEGTYTLVAVRDVNGVLKKKETEVNIKSGEPTNVTITD